MLISRSTENRQKFMFSLVFLLKMGGFTFASIYWKQGWVLYLNFILWNIYMPVDVISKKITKLIIRNASRERGAYPLNQDNLD